MFSFSGFFLGNRVTPKAISKKTQAAGAGNSWQDLCDLPWHNACKVRVLVKLRGMIRIPDQKQGMVYMTLLLRSSAALAVVLAMGAQASAAEKVTFGTNWLAQPEHGEGG